MGLDITAHSEIEVVELLSDYDEDRYLWPIDYINPHFPHAVPATWLGFEFVYYSVNGESHAFRAGSYGGYSMFRSALAEAFLGEPARRSDASGNFWETIERHEGKPFYELINFSDCEGVMAGPVGKKLYADFEQNGSVFLDSVSEKYDEITISRYASLYEDWTRAFELASDNGLVSFH